MRFFEKKFAREYDRRLTEEGYPGILLGAVTGELAGCSTVIDAGAGSGFFTIPLAEASFKVSAVEPSAEMLEILSAKISAPIKSRINLYREFWETWAGPVHDACISIHSLYPMQDREEALLKMVRSARRVILVLTVSGGGLSLTEILREKLKPGKPVRAGTLDEALKIFEKYGLAYRRKDLSFTRTRTFSDPVAEAEYYLYHIGLPPGMSPSVVSLLEEKCKRDNGIYLYASQVTDAFVTVYNK